MPTKKPTTLGAARRQYLSLREDRLACQKSLDGFKKREAEALDVLGEIMHREDTDVTKGPEGSVSKRVSTVAQATDWTKLYAWIGRTKNYEVLQKRIHQGNLVDVLEHSPRSKPGGVEFVQVVKFTATSSKK